MNEKNLFQNDIIDDARSDAYEVLTKKCGQYFDEKLTDKAVDTLAVAAVAVAYSINNETKQILAEAFNDTLNADEINKILTTDKQTLNEMLNAAKQLDELVKEDTLNESIGMDADELRDAAYTKERIEELTNYIEQQTQQITAESAPQQKQQTKERKHNTIDF